MELVCPICEQTFTPTQTRKPGPKLQKYCGMRCRNVGAAQAAHARRYGYIKPGLEPQLVPDAREIAWAAGFYEGEGTATLNCRSPRVAVGQKGDWCLLRLQKYFGGTVDSQRADGIQVWRVSGELARRFLGAVYDDLSPRRQEQADRALRDPGPKRPKHLQ